MKIHDDHLYHGAALIQIAEHPQFTAINALKLKNRVLRSGFKINDDIAVYLKYATEPVRQEYVFTFNRDHLQEIHQVSNANPRTLIALVCVKDREICSLAYYQLKELLDVREKALGVAEQNLTVLVALPKGKSMRVYVNAPGKKGKFLGKQLIISRTSFPRDIFV
jgi:hypothetical protein